MEAVVYLLLYVAFVTHKARKLSRMAVTLLPVFKNGGFDSCVGCHMTLLTNQWPAVC